MKKLLYEGDMKLDGQFDYRAFPFDQPIPSINKKELKKHDSDESSDKTITPTDGTEHPATPKFDRLQQQSRETRRKLRALGQYGIPSAICALQSPATAGAHKPFRVPFKEPQRSDHSGDVDV